MHLVCVGGCVYVCKPVPCQIPELLLAKTEGRGEESESEMATKGKSAGRIIISRWQRSLWLQRK